MLHKLNLEHILFLDIETVPEHADLEDLSPRDDIDGSQVRDVFYKEKDLDRIVTYCEKDVIAVAQLILKLRQEELLEDHELISV